ncbi:hypothetical protein GX50_00209 [[Emmonsia] crescens]|uniref:Uncharacterized protein n=1 Tax=[Emmonsia] crescens TaxID=73230 RepID=A0A2B7ZUW3_9EURO|nr:hypothetical protein GX50_00209 [Emmonsia crescens]
MSRVEKRSRLLLRPADIWLFSGSNHNTIVDEDGEKIWTRVNVDTSKINDDGSDNDSSSLVVVPRGSYDMLAYVEATTLK